VSAVCVISKKKKKLRQNAIAQGRYAYSGTLTGLFTTLGLYRTWYLLIIYHELESLVYGDVQNINDLCDVVAPRHTGAT
jgi:hypothetical protein